jgi:tetratricopeptide (TPR) repeat protein
VADVTRRLARETSPKTANDALDRVFSKFPSKKLRSHVWSVLPGGTIVNLAKRVYWAGGGEHPGGDTYGPNTKHPEIRRNIQSFIAANPSAPFIEFLHYTVGDFDKALWANPNSVIRDVIHYASGHSMLESLMRDTMRVVKPRRSDDDPTGVNDTIRFLNENPELYQHKPLASLVPNFASRAATAQTHFETVLRAASSPHADDAAYMLGWLALHQDKPKEALAYFSQAMVVGNADEDYKRPAAMKQTVRILQRHPAREQLTIVDADRAFAQQPPLWYVAARSAYRNHDYALAIEAAERALKVMQIPVDPLPVTTDPKDIDAALEKIDPRLLDDLHVGEIPYLLEASREILRYETYLKSLAAERPDNVFKRARAIIIKYSMLVDEPAEPARNRGTPELAHKDLRQALHMIETTLDSVPKTAQHTPLREWLHYRKVRILVVYAPKTVAQAIVAMEREFPTSQLMDDALAEQIYAEGAMLRDVSAAQRTFKKLADTYPRGNAIDNAHTWMAIVFRCEGRLQDALNMNREIIRRFPTTRHARYARERMANPKPENCGLERS